MPQIASAQVKAAKQILSELDDQQQDDILNQIVQVVNDAYQLGETGMFNDPKRVRTNLKEITDLVNQDKILCVWDEHANEVYGSVMCDCDKTDEEKKAGEPALLGMLSVKEECSKRGYGTMLVEACEFKAKSLNFKILQLELLVPIEPKHPYKTFLHNWYTTKFGFVMGEQRNLADHYPEQAAWLSVECYFTVYNKELTDPEEFHEDQADKGIVGTKMVIFLSIGLLFGAYYLKSKK